MQEAEHFCNHYCGPNPRSLLLLSILRSTLIRQSGPAHGNMKISRVDIKPFTVAQSRNLSRMWQAAKIIMPTVFN